MIKAVVLDLGSVLWSKPPSAIVLSTAQIVDQSLGDKARQPAFAVVLQRVLKDEQVATTLAERVNRVYEANILADLSPTDFTSLSSFTTPSLLVGQILQAAEDVSMPVHLATNPLLPRAAIDAVARSVGVSIDEMASVVSLETASFAQGTLACSAELIYRLGLDPHEILFASAEWALGIRPASLLGMHTFWIKPDYGSVPETTLPISRVGPLDDLLKSIQTGWMQTLGRTNRPIQAALPALRAFIPVLGNMVSEGNKELFLYCPEVGEWSARDVLCHLADYEREQVQGPLQRIYAEDDPFLTVDYDPLVSPSMCVEASPTVLFDLFRQRRFETIEWLQTLNKQDWCRPARSSIFGPTSLREMAYFVAEHDKLHLRQIKSAFEIAMTEIA